MTDLEKAAVAFVASLRTGGLLRDLPAYASGERILDGLRAALADSRIVEATEDRAMTDDPKTRLAKLAIDMLPLPTGLLATRVAPATIAPPPVEHPTTIDTLVDWARWHPCNRDSGSTGSKRHNHSLCEAGQTIIDALGVALPCGVETPTAGDDGYVTLPDVGGRWTVEDARGIAAAILRAAEAAEAASR